LRLSGRGGWGSRWVSGCGGNGGSSRDSSGSDGGAGVGDILWDGGTCGPRCDGGGTYRDGTSEGREFGGGTLGGWDDAGRELGGGGFVVRRSGVHGPGGRPPWVPREGEFRGGLVGTGGPAGTGGEVGAGGPAECRAGVRTG